MEFQLWSPHKHTRTCLHTHSWFAILQFCCAFFKLVHTYWRRQYHTISDSLVFKIRIRIIKHYDIWKWIIKKRERKKRRRLENEWVNRMEFHAMPHFIEVQYVANALFYPIATARTQRIGYPLLILTGPIRLASYESFFVQLMGGYTFHIHFNILLARFLINSLDTKSNVMIECSKFPSSSAFHVVCISCWKRHSDIRIFPTQETKRKAEK